MPDAAEWFTDNARVVVVLMLVASAVAVGGIPMVERSTSLDQFQTDADEARALEYSDEHFGAGTANETTVQSVVGGCIAHRSAATPKSAKTSGTTYTSDGIV